MKLRLLPTLFWCRSNIPFKVMAPCGGGAAAAAASSERAPPCPSHTRTAASATCCARAMPCCRILMCPSLWGTHNTYITTALPSLHSFHVLSYRSSVVRSSAASLQSAAGTGREGGRERRRDTAHGERWLHARPRY